MILFIVNKTNLISTKRKLTITEARKESQLKQELLKENLQQLEQIKKLCTINLDKKVTNQIIERAVSKRPIRNKPKPKKEKATAFTEEDFKRFEEEYFVE